VIAYVLFGTALLICLMSGALYAQLRPGVRRIKDGLNVLASNSYDNAEIRFVHRRTNRSVAFRKVVVGGVPQLLLIVNELNLTAQETTTLRELLKLHDLEIERRKGSKRGKPIDVIVLGHSTQKAADITVEIVEKVLKFSPFARFKFEHKGIKLRNSKGEYFASG
jgi:hypothetical protein